MCFVTSFLSLVQVKIGEREVGVHGKIVSATASSSKDCADGMINVASAAKMKKYSVRLDNIASLSNTATISELRIAADIRRRRKEVPNVNSTAAKYSNVECIREKKTQKRRNGK